MAGLEARDAPVAAAGAAAAPPGGTETGGSLGRVAAAAAAAAADAAASAPPASLRGRFVTTSMTSDAAQCGSTGQAEASRVDFDVFRSLALREVAGNVTTRSSDQK